VLVPFAPGGPSDVAGRIIAQRMSEVLGRQVVVENLLKTTWGHVAVMLNEAARGGTSSMS
jgi:tripartite-type tricarboxylate transporter receptor subunit TctC